MLLFGPGYTAGRIADRLERQGWTVDRVGRAGLEAAGPLIGKASHILSSVPPDGNEDPVLARHGAQLASAPARWIGYISSTGVYGDSAGAWVDESAPVRGRRSGRNAADQAWQALHPASRIFRLPGIYGPGRSALDRIDDGKAVRVDVPGQIFSRIHVDDIVSGVLASLADGPAGVFNLADDLPAPQNDVIAHAAMLLGAPLPPIIPPDSPELSPLARAFYAENRRIANGKARRLLGWEPRYPTYREGLAALIQERHPARFTHRANASRLSALSTSNQRTG